MIDREQERRGRELEAARAEIATQYPELLDSEIPNTVTDILNGCRLAHRHGADVYFRDSIREPSLSFFPRSAEDTWSLTVSTGEYGERNQTYIWSGEPNRQSFILNVRFLGGSVQISPYADQARIVRTRANGSTYITLVSINDENFQTRSMGTQTITALKRSEDGTVSIVYEQPNDFAGPMSIVLPGVITFHPSNK